MKNFLRYTYILAGLIAFAACKKDFDGAVKENKAPDTYVIADTIVRQGSNRFTSQVTIQWWGSDADGFITAYEFRLNGGDWMRTTRQDSAFTLIIPGSSDTFDFKFEVRSIDNKGLADASPATLFYPVKNTAPTINFFISSSIPSRNPVRSFPALHYSWTANDLDGTESLDSFEVCWNDTNGALTKIGPGIRDILMVGNNFSGSTTNCDIYLGSSQTPWTKQIGGLKLNDSNVFYIRAIDKVGAKSAFAATSKVFVRKPTDDILVVNAIESQFTRASIQNFYIQSLSNAVIKPYDILMATDRVGNNYTELSPDPFTQAQVFAFFKRIVWFSDNMEFSLGMLQKSSSLFFGKSGRLFAVCAANDNVPTEPLYLDFTPVKKFLPVKGSDVFLMQQNDSLLPKNAGWPYLTTPNFLTGIRPYELPLANSDFAYEALYDGRITNEKNGNPSPWTGISTLISKRKRLSDGKTDFIISVVPLHQFNGLSNFDAFMNRVVNTELEF